MAATLEELEQRLLALEAEVRALRTQLESPPAGETPAQRGERLIRLTNRSINLSTSRRRSIVPSTLTATMMGRF